MRKGPRLALLGLVSVFVLALSPSALGDESTYQIAVLYRSACPGFAIESVSGAISSCVAIPPAMWPPQPEYAAAANGAIVFVAPGTFNGGAGGYGPIWVVGPNGSMSMLDSSQYDSQPSISYDGSKVVFDRFDPATNSADIYSVNSDGSDLHEVVPGGANRMTVPAISPDGSSIAYWCTQAFYDPANNGCGPLTDGSFRSDGVMRVNIDGSNPRMIVIGPGSNSEPNGPNGLSWSPDGKWLATDGLNDAQVHPPWRYLFKYQTDGSDLFNNLDATRQITPQASTAWSPAFAQFSPDGSQLLYMDWMDGSGSSDQGVFSYLIGADGSNPHQIFLNPGVTCTNGLCGPSSYGAFIPVTATPPAPPALVDAMHETVPSVAHLTVQLAKSTLAAAHLSVGTVHNQSSSLVPAGHVISQNPTAGSTAHRTTKQGPPVALVVSTGLTRILTVAKGGVGSGTVTSTPVGIACGTTCTHRFAKGTSVKLVVTAASGSVFSGWSGACTGTGVCRVAMSQARTVSAKFSRKPCVVPNVKGKLLASAKAALALASCATGTVSQAYSSTVQAGYVISESPAAGSKLAPGAKVALVVSKGPAG